MPRVLHVVLSLRPGGAERLVIELVRRLQGEYASAVCCLDEAGAWAGQLPSGTEVVVLDRRPGFHPLFARRLADTARLLGANLMHCHQYSPFVYGTLAQAFDRNLRIVATEHGRLDDHRVSTKRRVANRFLNLGGAKTFAVSRHLRDELIAEGFPAAQVDVLHNGIDPGPDLRFAARAQARETLGVADDDTVVGAVGRLAQVKDFSTLLAAMEAAPMRVASARLVIVGDGPERDTLARRVRELGLEALVTLVGHRDDVRDLLPAFDLFVSSSVYEGISLTLLEAMAAGLPVVATRVGGTTEVVNEGVTGLLVPPRNAGSLASSMAEVLADRARAARLGAAGRARVIEAFHIDTMVRRYADVYRRLGAA